MSFYKDLHNLYYGNTKQIVGPITETIQEESCKKDADLKEPSVDLDYKAQLDMEYREQQIEKLVNTAALGAGFIWFWNVLNRKDEN